MSHAIERLDSVAFNALTRQTSLIRQTVFTLPALDPSRLLREDEDDGPQRLEVRAPLRLRNEACAEE